MAEVEELKIRTAQNVKMLWKDASRVSFMSHKATDTEDPPLLKLKLLTTPFSINI